MNIKGSASSEVAIIIVNYNSGSMLLQCLNNLSRQTWTSFRVIIVDNASTDDSMNIALELSLIHI